MTLEIPDAQFKSIPHSVCGGRLTSVQGNPVPSRLVAYASSTKLYWLPYKGNRVGLSDGSVWRIKKFNELSIKLTDTQAGDLISGSTTVSNVNDTSQLIVGMEVTGTGIAANSVISSIPDDHTLILNNAATATGRRDLTVSVPVDSNVDVYAGLDYAYNPKLFFGTLWTNDYQRVNTSDIGWYNGVLVSADTSGSPYVYNPLRRYLGTIRTNPTTAGYTQSTYDTAGNVMRRNIWNLYNQEWYSLLTYNTAANWSCSATSVREYRAGTGQVRAEFVFGTNWPIPINAVNAQYATAATTGMYCILTTSMVTGSGASLTLCQQNKQCHDVTPSIPPIYYYSDYSANPAYPSPGYNYVSQFEVVGPGDTFTVYGTGYYSRITILC